MEKYASYDLHLHSVWSYDATAEVEQHCSRAAGIGLKTIAITDHNNIGARKDVEACRLKYPGLMILHGAEFTVKTPFGCIDMVCLRLPENPGPRLRSVLDRYAEMYRSWPKGYMDAVNVDGVVLKMEDMLKVQMRYRPERVVAEQGPTLPNWNLFKKIFVDNGVISDVREWDDWMEPYWKNYKGMGYPDYSEVVPVLKEEGCLIFIAHPFGYFKGCDVERMDNIREILRLDGIECAHPSVPSEMTPKYREYCLANNLLSSGGSDAHAEWNNDFLGIDGSRVQIGGHCGQDEWLEEIMNRIDRQ